MSKTWCFYYYGWFGCGDSSDDIEFETDVSEEEYSFLKKVDAYQNSDSDDEKFDYDDFLEKNQELINNLQNRVQTEAEECDYENYDEDDEKPDIVVRWPWE